MDSAVSKGDTVSVEYVSDRSENVVSRSGHLLQTPGEGKSGLFVQTDEHQITGVMGERVYSLTVDMNDGERTIRNKTYLGELDTVSDT